MLIKRIIIENLRSYKKQEIFFPSGSTLLSGDIGSGKTTVLLAIEFALFGIQPGQKGASLLRNGEDFGKVELEFEIDGINIIIERTLKRQKKSITQDYASIIIDNEKYEESVTEIKGKVLKLLNYPSEFAKKTNLLYKFTVYTPQEEMKQIILESGDVRLNTLRHVFGIDKYKRIEENLTLLAIKLREKIRVNEGMLFDLEIVKESLKQKKDNLISLKEKQKTASNDFEKTFLERQKMEESILEVQEKINQKNSLESEKSKSNFLISEKKQQIATLNSSIKNSFLQLQESKKILFNEKDFEDLNKKIALNEEKEESLQREYIQVIGRINSEESKQKEALLLKNKISGLKKCPTCLQEVSDDYKNKIFIKTDAELLEIDQIINGLAIRKNYLNEQV
jgi:exonuclease SbcC